MKSSALNVNDVKSSQKKSAFPAETQASLLKFDVSGDQQLDALEVLKAFNVYEEQMLAQEKGTVPFALFAPEVQARLEKFDVSGKLIRALACPTTLY